MVKTYPIQIWFLDEDLDKSAQALANKQLNSTINGCIQAMVNTRLWCAGIRSIKFYKHYFSKDLEFETLDRLFPCWPLQQLPRFLKYSSVESKWTRKCKNHYDYVKMYLNSLINEFEYRFKKECDRSQFLEWENVDAPEIKLKEIKLSKIVLPWKNINIKYRSKDIIQAYRKQYKHIIGHPIAAYSNVSRNIPEWLIDDNYEI